MKFFNLMTQHIEAHRKLIHCTCNEYKKYLWNFVIDILMHEQKIHSLNR